MDNAADDHTREDKGQTDIKKRKCICDGGRQRETEESGIGREGKEGRMNRDWCQ